MHIRTVTRRDQFRAQHLELDFGDDLVTTTNNRLRASRALTLLTKGKLVVDAPHSLARGDKPK